MLMVRMIGELLNFTRGRLGGGVPIQPRPSNLRLLCNQVLEELESSHPGRELRLTAEGQFQGEWDPDRLVQLLGNLGKNALDSSPLGSSVDFSLHDEGEAVRVEVHNGGPPIPLDLLPNIFEPFRPLCSRPLRPIGLLSFLCSPRMKAWMRQTEAALASPSSPLSSLPRPPRGYRRTSPRRPCRSPPAKSCGSRSAHQV